MSTLAVAGAATAFAVGKADLRVILDPAASEIPVSEACNIQMLATLNGEKAVYDGYYTSPPST